MTYKDAASALHAIAADQAGYFTAQQARKAGYSYRAQNYQVSAGNWIKVDRGIYRLHNFPSQEREDLAVLTLLGHNRAGEPQAVVSHDTALAIHELSDINPAAIHLTVPPRFRKRMPDQVRFHVARLLPGDWEQREGYRVTTPLRTLLDEAASPLSQELLEGAVREALARGMVREKTLLAAHAPQQAMSRIRRAAQTSRRK
jgi:predicted transcriptional regulator of viral defense system